MNIVEVDTNQLQYSIENIFYVHQTCIRGCVIECMLSLRRILKQGTGIQFPLQQCYWWCIIEHPHYGLFSCLSYACVQLPSQRVRLEIASNGDYGSLGCETAHYIELFTRPCYPSTSHWCISPICKRIRWCTYSRVKVPKRNQSVF